MVQHCQTGVRVAHWGRRQVPQGQVCLEVSGWRLCRRAGGQYFSVHGLENFGQTYRRHGRHHQQRQQRHRPQLQGDVAEQTAGANRVPLSLSNALHNKLESDMASLQKRLAGVATGKTEKWANSMATNARRRASAMEDTAAKARTEGWRNFLGATSEKGDGVFTPGRGAYKWIK